jgi:hypothetical protein
MPAWRDSYKPARFFMLDARITFAILPTLIHIRWYTLLPTAIIGATLWYVETYLEMDMPSAIRAVRSFIAGPIRPNSNLMKLRKPVDYDRIKIE